MAENSSRWIENGFPVNYCSDVDGDRYIIIDPQDADMSGWRIEVGRDPSWDPSFGDWQYEPTEHDNRTDIEEFTTEHCWFRNGSYWNGLGFGEDAYPWSAMVDHGRKIVRWIPPDES